MGVNNLSYSGKGEGLSKSFETLRLVAYDDKRPNYLLQPGERILGTLTIGWGHTGADVFIGQTITEDEANALWEQDSKRAEIVVNTYVDVVLTQGEFDALVDLVFNIGSANFKNSTLLRLLNVGDYHGAANEIDKWDHAGGVVLAGLLRRRQAETVLFNQV